MCRGKRKLRGRRKGVKGVDDSNGGVKNDGDDGCLFGFVMMVAAVSVVMEVMTMVVVSSNTQRALPRSAVSPIRN